MLTTSDVFNKVMEIIETQGVEPVNLANALGRVIAYDVKSRASLPFQDLSAINGYAVNSAEITQIPITLNRVAKLRPNEIYRGKLKPGETIYLNEGTPIPDGADCVISPDKVTKNGLFININEHPNQGENIIGTGIDVEQREVIFKKGTAITSRHIAMAAKLKVQWLPVVKIPKIGILVNTDDLLDVKEIYDGYSKAAEIFSMEAALVSFIESKGGAPVNLGVSMSSSASVDHIIEFKAQLKQAIADIDMLVTIGGVHDLDDNLMWTSLNQGGAVLEKLSVAVGNGETLIIGHQDDIPIVGLSNNIVSALICSAIFLQPMIRKMLCVPQEHDKHYAVLDRSLDPYDMSRDFLYANMTINDEGKLVVMPYSAQDSLMLSVLIKSDCLIIIDKGKSNKKGDLIEVINL